MPNVTQLVLVNDCLPFVMRVFSIRLNVVERLKGKNQPTPSILIIEHSSAFQSLETIHRATIQLFVRSTTSHPQRINDRPCRDHCSPSILTLPINCNRFASRGGEGRESINDCTKTRGDISHTSVYMIILMCYLDHAPSDLSDCAHPRAHGSKSQFDSDL